MRSLSSCMDAIKTFMASTNQRCNFYRCNVFFIHGFNICILRKKLGVVCVNDFVHWHVQFVQLFDLLSEKMKPTSSHAGSRKNRKKQQIRTIELTTSQIYAKK